PRGAARRCLALHDALPISFIRIPLAIMAGAAAAPVALAHHGFGTFVMDEDIEITGTVTGLDFVNPHSSLYLDVVDESGEAVAMRDRKSTRLNCSHLTITYA